MYCTVARAPTHRLPVPVTNLTMQTTGVIHTSHTTPDTTAHFLYWCKTRKMKNNNWPYVATREYCIQVTQWWAWEGVFYSFILSRVSLVNPFNTCFLASRFVFYDVVALFPSLYLSCCFIRFCVDYLFSIWYFCSILNHWLICSLPFFYVQQTEN